VDLGGVRSWLLLVRRLGHRTQFQFDAVLEHVSDFEEGFVIRVELSAVFDLAKGGLEDGETVPRLEDVDEILGFDAVHGGNLCIYGTMIRAAQCADVGDACHASN
jgi:hypothetical protein